MAGQAGTKSRINIIVATNPDLRVNQAIACSYFRNNSSNDTTIVEEMRFPLPPVPGEDGDTLPIYVTEGGGSSVRTAYINLNTVLVAYSFEVPSTNTRTYYLAATDGAASFVYFSVERTAADKNRNPEHDNELFFPVLNGIDYVYSMPSEEVRTIISVKDNNYVIY